MIPILTDGAIHTQGELTVCSPKACLYGSEKPEGSAQNADGATPLNSTGQARKERQQQDWHINRMEKV
jgi:hypothetical protein